MLEEINRLSVFFEDCYREISVREYSRENGMSPPTASAMLKGFEKKGLLIKREERGFLFFRVNQESKLMRDLSRIYWGNKLSGLIKSLEADFPKAIVLFGSLSKLEVRKESDIDLAVFGSVKSEIALKKFEKELGRETHIMFYDSLDKVNKELRLNLINGYIIRGYLS